MRPPSWSRPRPLAVPLLVAVDISPQFDLDLLRNFNSQLTKG